MNPPRKAIQALGLVSIAVGAYLPWVVNVDPRSLTYVVGMGTGLEVWGLVTLPLAALALIGLVGDGRRFGTPRFRSLTAIVGLGAVVVHVLSGYGVSGTLRLGSGAYVTVLGVILVAAPHVASAVTRRLGRGGTAVDE